MSHVDDGQLHAYLDGELAALTPAETARVERHLAACAECRRRLKEECGVRDRSLAILGGSGPGELVAPAFDTLGARRSASRAERPRAATRRSSLHAFAWAASLLAALAVGWFGRELLRQPAETRLAAESAATADRPAAAGTDTRVAAPQASPLADAAPATRDAPAEPAPPALAARSAAPRAAAPPAADVASTAAGSAAAPAPAGEAVAHGRVTNEAGVGIPNVSIQIPALNAGTLTRADGSYSLVIPAARLGMAEDLAITATQVGMRGDSQRLVLQPGEEVAANFALRPETVALEGIVVTGRARESRQGPVAAEAAALRDAVDGEVRWEPVDRAEAERRLGGRLRLVPGLPTLGISARVEEGQPVIRTVQRLEGGEWRELLQQRKTPATEPAVDARAAGARAEAAPAATAPPRPAVDAADGLASLVTHRDGFRITTRAPISADSLRALLSRVP
ncbi:MAG TPA: zf-HC2 domain-containing protein [Longimicrobiaceae bacterium]|nr:zf-HC2 domain-containing protein [Longimicrobiaceae bacterium]